MLNLLMKKKKKTISLEALSGAKKTYYLSHNYYNAPCLENYLDSKARNATAATHKAHLHYTQISLGELLKVHNCVEQQGSWRHQLHIHGLHANIFGGGGGN